MTEHTASDQAADGVTNLNDRLARLAERRARDTSRAVPAVEGAKAPETPARTKRAHPAAASRVVAAGLSSSVFLSIMGAFGVQSAASGATNTKPIASAAIALPAVTMTPTTIVVKNVHHKVFVDPSGRPITLTTVSPTATLAPNAGRPAAGAGPGPGASRAYAPQPLRYSAPAPVAAPSQSAPPANVAPPNAPPPTPAAPPPPPVTTPHVTPPTMVVHPPPPPCTGSKCP